MRIDVLTIFPEMFAPVLGASMLKRGQQRGRLRISVHDLRDYTKDKHRKVDDRPYGGGPGMVMRPEPIVKAVNAMKRVCRHRSARTCQTILMSPQGNTFSQAHAARLAKVAHLIVICGHYEGVDERVRLAVVDQMISIGDYVLTGGELPAMVVIDSVARLIPGVIGHAQATKDESFVAGYLEYPHYTRPQVFNGLEVPEVLRSGDHERVAQWRRAAAMERTRTMRPDLIRANGKE